ncbi:hypothetical protein BLA29_003758, partial [Euroglyphus maynei]
MSESSTSANIVNENTDNQLENIKFDVKLRDKKQSSNSPVESHSVRPLGIIIDPTEEDVIQEPQLKSNRTDSVDLISEQQPQEREYNIDPALYFHNRNSTLESFRDANDNGNGGGKKKSDSLDSTQQQQVCCTKLAFNFYNKALDSAKKHLPNRNKQKNRYSGGFPRSFGEDFHSLGPEGFYYLDDTQTECSLDYRDIEFNRDSFIFTGSEVIPELSEEEFFDNKIRHKSKENPQKPATDCPARHFTQLPVLSGEQTASSIKQMDEPKENSPESIKRKGPSLFEWLFKTNKDKNKDRKKSRKARSESRERERVRKNVRSTSLPPATMGGKHSQQTQYPVMKLGPDGQLYFEQDVNIISATPVDPNEAILSNVTRQSPIKLVYARPPEIIVREVTNLADTIDTLPRIQSTDSQPLLTKPSTAAITTTVDDVAEKTMMDILDDAIRQLREESQIPSINVNENAESNQNPSGEENSLKNNKKRNPIFGMKKRKIPGYASPMAKLKDINLKKPKFFQKSKHFPNENESTIEFNDSK